MHMSQVWFVFFIDYIKCSFKPIRHLLMGKFRFSLCIFKWESMLFSLRHILWLLDLNLKVKAKVLVSPLCLTFCDPIDYAAHEAPLSMKFSRQEYWSELPYPSPRDLPYPAVEPGSPTLQVDSLLCEPHQGSLSWKPLAHRREERNFNSKRQVLFIQYQKWKQGRYRQGAGE